MGLTPAMQQFMEIKNKYKDCIVFFRMGDFYETFYDDAKIVSKALDITLTKRRMKNSNKGIPLAGIPYHALDTYLAKMVNQGFKVVIVEQLEDPKKAKGVVKRGVVRIVTPGTVIEENMLTKNNNFIASVFIGEKIGLSFVDISTGEFVVTEISENNLLDELKKKSPNEVLFPTSYENSEIHHHLKDQYYITLRSDVDYYIENAKENLKNKFKVESLDGFGLKNKEFAISSCGAMISYLNETQRNSLDHLNTIKFFSTKDFMLLDNTTIKNLELINKENSLLSVLDNTMTSMGSRMLKQFILNPLIKKEKIELRLLAVEELKNKPFILEDLRDLLKNIADLERLISRINYGNANPRDLLQLQGSLELVPRFIKILNETESGLLGKLSELKVLREVTSLIDESIIDEPPAIITEGNFIKDLYNEELDRYREISRNAKSILREIEEKERIETGIKSLKIRYNRIFGYFIDVTKTNLSLIPSHYIKKQTLVNSERFITDELKELEDQILHATENIVKIEQELYGEIIEKIKKFTKDIQENANKLALLDVICNFTKISIMNNYVKPMIFENYKLKLVECRHPIVEKLTDFIPNDLSINVENRMMIITGPNMAGKSIFMKQIALNIIMAQIGCYVPCDFAEVSIVDKVFSRTGASDDITTGQSTFMVEMTQAAYILNNATENSFIILDEIGRGTSTYDGVAIAWAVVEHITKKIQCKTLFATHYHVLNNLEKEISGIKNYNIAVEESKDNIIFLRKIIEGGTDKSYGIHVAKIAGMPKEVIQKSKEIQFKLEKDDEISEKIIVETRKSQEIDNVNEEIEETERLIKSKQLRLDQI
ncbi:DNA mismatch repair protein MutS [archaeon]|nr:DNA mismatch repair protein MutS [archaeon]MBT4272183.1 DNA mismatch repair protein MutS [archaeon]